MHKREALLETMEACTIPVLTSGSVLLISGFLIHAISSHGVLKQIGWFLGVGVSISLVAVLFALPGFLYVLDGLIGKTTLKAHFCPRMPRIRFRIPPRHRLRTAPLSNVLQSSWKEYRNAYPYH